ncbi:hypothetical protein [Niveispirillum sp.]|uniref:hypothetical protein n=1 Tax=Niveispirillum sp. TaxID=1917217 RepID=UPI001B7CA2D4|nr:hypothetical protein [Niveispirillum sp.]MBP7337835.1 hypothetical protein [Niveispirillum sp.]
MDDMKVMLLAEALYQKSNSTAVPWGQRDRTIRKTWIDAARQQIERDAATAKADLPHA